MEELLRNMYFIGLILMSNMQARVYELKLTYAYYRLGSITDKGVLPVRDLYQFSWSFI